MKIFGIDFAIFNIPLQRRLQTLVVAQWFFGCLIAPLLMIGFIVFSLITPLMPITLCYLLWIFFYDWNVAKRGGRRVEFIRKSRFWNYYRDYFPIKLVKTSSLDPSKNYILGYHPHGILVCSAFCNFCTDSTHFSSLYPNIRPFMLTLATNFYFPILRGLLLALGACDASKESIEHILNKEGSGNMVVLVVGGAEEALESRPHIYRLKLKNRKGFVKMAIRNGADLVPCFGFHENEIFQQVDNPQGSLLRKFQEKIKGLFGISPPLFYGRGIFNYTFGLMPFRKQLTTVIGSPISVKQNPNPSNEEINAMHQKYLDCLYDLFETNKKQYGINDSDHLTFV